MKIVWIAAGIITGILLLLFLLVCVALARAASQMVMWENNQ